MLTETSVFEQLLCLLPVVPIFAPNCLSVDVEHFMGVDTEHPRLPGQCHMASNRGSSLFPKESNSLNPAAPDLFLRDLEDRVEQENRRTQWLLVA